MRWGDSQQEARIFPGEESYTSTDPNPRYPRRIRLTQRFKRISEVASSKRILDATK